MTSEQATLFAASVSAVAALIAVLFATTRAGITEKAKWRRETTLTASAAMVASLHDCKKAGFSRSGAQVPKSDAEKLERADDAFNSAFAIVRLVGSSDLLEPAGHLAAAQMRFYLSIGSDHFHSVDHYSDLDSLEGRFVNAVRREFGLPRGPLESG